MRRPQASDGAPRNGLVDVLAMLVTEHDETDLLARLLRDCAGDLGASAALALMARDSRGQLSLLSASSHHAAHLKLLEAQRDQGPCLDAMRAGRRVEVEGSAQIRGHWPEVGPALTTAGFDAVLAFPLRWQGETFGALSMLLKLQEGRIGQASRIGQSYADVATLVVVHATTPPPNLAARLQHVLESRQVVEQAKGVLAHVLDLDVGLAYDELVRRAEAAGISLTRAAHEVLVAQRRPGTHPLG